MFNEKIRHIDALVEGIRQDHECSSLGKSDFGLWRGHEVNFEFVCLLNHIMRKYPENLRALYHKKQEVMYNEVEYVVHHLK